jgi:hypothetical protein
MNFRHLSFLKRRGCLLRGYNRRKAGVDVIMLEKAPIVGWTTLRSAAAS